MARVALDSNLLILLVVGSVSRDYISKHRRLQAYSVAEFELLIEVISGADQMVVTPNALTEVSNLLVYRVIEPLRSDFLDALRRLIDQVTEKHQPSRVACGEPEYLRLGLADSAWLGCLDSETVFLTDDLELYLAVCSRGTAAYNFTRMREQRGSL